MTWKKATMITLALLLIVSAIPLVAQNNDNDDLDDYGELGWGEFNGDEFDFFAQQQPMDEDAGPGWRGRFSEMRKQIPDELKLTDEQREKMRNLRLQHQKEMVPMRADLKVLRIELRELMGNDANQSALNNKIEQIGKMRTEIEKKRVAHMLAMRSVLTKEQQEAFKGMGLRGGHGGWGDRFGGRGNRGFGKSFGGNRGECDGDGPHGPRGGGRGW